MKENFKKQLWLFNALRRHRKLSEERMMDLEKNKAAKWVIYVVVGLFTVYLLMFAIIFAMAANTMRTMSTVEFILGVAPFMMVVDFFVRFSGQQTPSQIIKPYVLLPMPRYTCVDFFLGGQMLNSSNLIWFIMLVPYCLMSVVFSHGLWVALGLLLFFWLLELCISQFYLIVRTLLNDTLVWWLLPVAVLIVAALPGVQWEHLAEVISLKFQNVYDFEDMWRFYAHLGRYIEDGSLLPYLVMMAAVAVLFFIDRQIQYSHVMSELSRTEKIVKVSNGNSLRFLDRLGELGLYLGLEIKTSLRNKNPRKSLIMGIAIVVVFSLVIIFTDVYDNAYMGNFWCMYNYTIFGAMTLVKIMCNEGNYIDGLMVRKENILQILRAKYWFNCIILLLPFLLMMPTVMSGKWDFLMVFSYGIFTAGFQFFLLFQLAVINRSAQPLNTKFISKNGVENNYWQVVIEMVCLFVPVVFASVLQTLMGDTWAYVIMLLIGVAFVATHHLWLRNIYNRFMKRRYKNLEGFRASR